MSQLHQRPPVAESSDPFDVVSNLGGAELLDELHHSLRSVNPVEFALFSGAMRSTESMRYGQMVESVGEFRPGIDQPTQINIPATLAAERPQASRIRTDVDIPKLVIVADLPERLHNSTGQQTLHTLGRYGIALSLTMANHARSRASLILAEDQGVGEVFEDSAQEGYLAMESIDDGAELTPVTDESPLAAALQLADETVIPERDVTLVISDFMDGYSSETDDFDWSDGLQRLQGGLDDRLLVMRLASDAQQDLPVGLSDLPISRVMELRTSYMEAAARKATRISDILATLRQASIDGSDTEIHPVMQINEFLVGED